MRRRARRPLTFLFAAVFSLTSLFASVSFAAEPVIINYVALGDSIATGTVDYWSSISPYVKYFHDFLKTQHPAATVNLTNLAQDGDRSNELLAKLRNSDFAATVANAQVITISMGGNNLMQAAAVPGFTSIDWGLADQGVTDFAEQWPQIVQKIRELNPTAKIIVLTVYNPYNKSPSNLYKDDRGLFDATEPYLHQINDLIRHYAQGDKPAYSVADVNGAFMAYQPSSMGSVTYMYPAWYQYLFRNPHPQALGQQIITSLHQEAYLADPYVPGEPPAPPQPTKYSLSLEADPTGLGEQWGDGEYAAGTNVSVSTTLPDGYTFTGWKDGDQIIHKDLSFDYIMPERNVTLLATFQQDEQPVTPLIRVTEVSFASSGSNLNITFSVRDAANQGVAGAAIQAVLMHDGAYLTDISVTTNRRGNATYRYSKAPTGAYVVHITSVTASGYEWDGQVPENLFTRK